MRARGWLPWAIIAAIAAIAIAAAFVLVPRMASSAASQDDAATPPSDATSTPDPADTPETEPTPPCVVTAVDDRVVPTTMLDVPADGAFTAVHIADLATDDFSVHPVDDDVFALAVDSGGTGGELLILDRHTGSVVWQTTLTAQTAVTATPAWGGPADTIVVSETFSDSARSVLTFYDLATGQVDRTLDLPDGGGLLDADDEFIWTTDFEKLTVLDAASHELVWSTTGADHGVGAHEFGVPFIKIDDLVFVGGKALDAATGESLGWETHAVPQVGAGRLLAMPLADGSFDPYALAGIDARTGEVCWSLEVIGFDADDEALWAVTTDEILRRIDPATGETLEERGAAGYSTVNIFGDAVVTTPRDWSTATTGDVRTVFTPDGSWTIPYSTGGLALGSHGLLLAETIGDIETPDVLHAYDGSGTEVWTLATRPTDSDVSVYAHGSVLIRTTPLSSGVRVELLR